MTATSIGVAISTTGDLHRLPLLAASVQGWRAALPQGPVFVTVDGDEAALERVEAAVGHGRFGYQIVSRVGQKDGARAGRLGVAVNKNTGIEALMNDGAEHLFLSDDDCRPLVDAALTQHIKLAHLDIPHSMVCWGANRHPAVPGQYASWSWPRGVMLYAHRSVVEQVGGMIEAFGPGGHEHVEWSRRIHQRGLTPAPYLSPIPYARSGPAGRATGAGAFWACEDMRRPAEHLATLGQRRKALTTLRRERGDMSRANRLMDARDGDTTFVPFTAAANGRESATVATTA